MVRIAIGTGAADPAPEHLLAAERFPYPKSLSRPFIDGPFSRLHHYPGEFVPQSAGKGSKARVKYISLLIGLGHMDITAADSAGSNFYQNLLFVLNLGDVLFHHVDLRVPPNLTPQPGKLAFNVLGPKLEVRPGLPLSG